MAFDAELMLTKPATATITDYKTIDFKTNPAEYSKLLETQYAAYQQMVMNSMTMPSKPAGSVLGCLCDDCVRMRGTPRPQRVTKAEAVGYLKAARDLIAKGWCQGSVNDMRGNVCSVGAILAAVQGRRLPATMGRGEEDIVNAVARMMPGIGSAGSLIRFNDMRETTQKDVLRLFDHAIRELSGQPEPEDRVPYYLPRTMSLAGSFGL